MIIKNINCGMREDGDEIGGSRVHFPSAPVKHLACLLYTSDAADDWLVV